MQSRTQYLIFLTIWGAALIAAFIILMAYGFSVGGDIRVPLLLSGLLALAPAAAGYIL